ncbi:unnamed protein product [Sphagnum troendelagicum]
MKKNENWPSFWPFSGKNLFLFSESFSTLCLFHHRYLCHTLEGHVPSRPRGRKAASTYNCLDNLGYIWDLNAAKQHMSKKSISLDQCLSDDIFDVSQKMGIARKKRDDLHKLTQANRSFSHYRWW